MTQLHLLSCLNVQQAYSATDSYLSVLKLLQLCPCISMLHMRISRRVYPPLSIFQHHSCLICSNSCCWFGYLSRWSVCQCSLGGGNNCHALLIDPSQVLNDNHSEPLFPAFPAPQLSLLAVSPSVVHPSPEKLILLAVQAAIDYHICTELASIKCFIFDTFMMASLHDFTVCHVSHVILLLLASCLCRDFLMVERYGV